MCSNAACKIEFWLVGLSEVGGVVGSVVGNRLKHLMGLLLV